MHDILSSIRSSNRSVAFALGFLIVFGVLYGLYAAARGTVVERLIIDTLTVQPSAAVINWISPGEAVTANGHRLLSAKARLSVLNGCEGTESLLLLIAAIAAFSASWRAKLVGMLFGTVVIYVINQGRIIGLYYALRHERAWFEALHGFVAPTLIILIGALFFMWWIAWAGRGPHEHQPAV